MDRGSFLASLPFLIRLPSSAWPPPYHIHLVVLAGDHSYGSFQLSIECGRRRNPAFFCASNTSTGSTSSSLLSRLSSTADPAQTQVELVLCHILVHNNNHDNDNDNDRTNAPVTAFLRVDGHVYALNLSAVRAMTMVPETLRPSDPDRTTQTNNSIIATPPSLCLEFLDSLQLRFFRSTGTVDDCVEDRAFWNGVRDTLREAVSVEHFQYESILAGSSSPERSSTSTTTGKNRSSSSSKTLSGAEPQDFGHDHSSHQQQHHTATTDPNEPEDDHSPPKNQEDRAAAFLPRRRHHAARECTERLGWIRHILELPAHHFRPSDNSTTTTPALLPQLGPRLTQTAECWPAAYLSAEEHSNAVRYWDTRRMTAQQDLEQTLQQFFPSRRQQRHRKRLRTTQQHTTPMDDDRTPVRADAALALEQLVEQHKQATVERYKLFLLPSRG